MPSSVEAGFPDLDSNAWFGLFAPAGTPRDVITLLHGEIVRLFKEPEFVQKEIAAKGYELVASSPEEFAAFIRSEIAQNAKLARLAGIKPE